MPPKYSQAFESERKSDQTERSSTNSALSARDRVSAMTKSHRARWPPEMPDPDLVDELQRKSIGLS